jgi:hypothetical protein
MMYGPSDVPFRVGTSSIGPHGTSGKGKGGKGDGKGKVNVSARANLYYYALEHGLLAETLEEQERQGTASGQDAPLHGLQPGRMSHGSSDEDDAKRRATPHRKAWQKEYDAKRKATPHRKAYKKEYNAKRRATPQYKAKQKECDAKYQATPQYKAYRKEYDAEYRKRRRVEATRLANSSKQDLAPHTASGQDANLRF